MDTITRTFPVTLTSTYTPGTVIEVAHIRDMTFDTDERVGVYIEAFFCNISLKSFALGKIPEFDGDETEAGKMAKFTASETASQKLGMRILSRKSNTGNWKEKAEIILVNRGRKDYFDLLTPYLAKYQVRLLEKNDAIAIQLIDYGNGLLKVNDFIEIEIALRVEIAKKNDINAFTARLEALELALEGRLTNLPGGILLGRNGTTGTVQQILQSQFATPASVTAAINALTTGSSTALDTLAELGAALANDANFAATITNALALKAPIANPSFTGLVSTSGQVAFPALQIPSGEPNILDDYEEGNWTPRLTYTSVGTASITHSRQSGRYQKIGNRVNITFDIRISSFSKGSASGFLIISGLPFATRAGGGFDNNYGFLVVANAPFGGIPFIDTGTGLSGGAGYIFLFKAVSNAVNVPLEDPVSGALYWGQLTYEAAN